MTSSLKHHVGGLAFFTIIAIALSWSVIGDFSQGIIGEGGDPWQTMWRFEDQESRILNIEFWTTFFGPGEPQLVNYSTLPWLPLQMIFGQPIAYNLVWLFSFILSGYAMYLLVQYLLTTHYKLPTTKWAAALAGLYYMLLPYHLAHAMGHFGAMQLLWLPLAILAFMRFIDRPSIWNTLGLAAAIAIQAWTEHHYALWLVLFYILYSIFFWPPVRRLGAHARPYLVLLASLVFFFVVLPYWPTLQLATQENSLLNLGVDQTIRFSADLLSYVVPASFHPFWGSIAEHVFRQHFTGNAAEATHYVGLVGLLLVVFFRQKVPARQYGFWVLVAAVFLGLSLGPQLHVMGRVLPIPLPYTLVSAWPLFSSVRAVGRAGVMVGLAIAVLLGWVIATQVRRRWVGVTLAGFILLDFLFGTLPQQAYALSPAYGMVRQLSGSRIIELPAATNYTVASQALYASRRHGKEVVGTVALERAEDSAQLEEIRSLPALRHLLYVRTGQLRLDRPDFFNQDLPTTLAETLDWLDVGGIVVHSDSLSTLQLATIRNFLETDMGLVPQEFNDVIVYPVLPEVRERGDGVFLARDGRWTNVGYDEERGHVFAEIPTEVGITLYNTTAQERRVRLRLPVALESHGNMQFISAASIQQLMGRGGDILEVIVVLPAHSRQAYTLRNQLTQKVIIQDPTMTVDGL